MGALPPESMARRSARSTALPAACGWCSSTPGWAG